ncbi:BPL-N domain-containing protein [Iodobacter sp. CM08]|uniref:BPL-N domain-containing protein n=1 Tax=Iodobacter sp. CM08 TaxID=3085902 RepID=UPI0029813F02|nr:BPL-N domain-containing protein [Iodobacter sp. CM08]MDW5416933.1 BPL-N domain-containing protein [Iodobacter sp. CM08]
MAQSNRLKKVLIYNGPGTCQGCPEAIGHVLKKAGFNIQYIKPGQLTKRNFLKAAMYVQPGGSDDASEVMDALSENEIRNLKSFVFNGGKYLGICSGGYLAGQHIVDEDKVKSFGLLPTTVYEEQEDAEPKIETIRWKNKKLSVYFQSGPAFNLNHMPNADIWAIYKNTGNGAALINNYGHGRVGVIGPHLEGTRDWFEDNDLEFPGLSHDLLMDFINALLQDKSTFKRIISSMNSKG